MEIVRFVPTYHLGSDLQSRLVSSRLEKKSSGTQTSILYRIYRIILSEPSIIFLSITVPNGKAILLISAGVWCVVLKYGINRYS